MKLLSCTLIRGSVGCLLGMMSKTKPLHCRRTRLVRSITPRRRGRGDVGDPQGGRGSDPVLPPVHDLAISDIQYLIKRHPRRAYRRWVSCSSSQTDPPSRFENLSSELLGPYICDCPEFQRKIESSKRVIPELQISVDLCNICNVHHSC